MPETKTCFETSDCGVNFKWRKCEQKYILCIFHTRFDTASNFLFRINRLLIFKQKMTWNKTTQLSIIISHSCKIATCSYQYHGNYYIKVTLSGALWKLNYEIVFNTGFQLGSIHWVTFWNKFADSWNDFATDLDILVPQNGIVYLKCFSECEQQTFFSQKCAIKIPLKYVPNIPVDNRLS